MPLLRTDLKDKTMKGPQLLSPLPSKAVSSADGLMQYSSLNSVATALLEIKEVIFMQTKMTIWNQAIKETTTPTSAPPDEYERPEDLKEININRVEARNVHSMNMKDSLSFSERLKISVFGQLKVITLLSTVSFYVHIRIQISRYELLMKLYLFTMSKCARVGCDVLLGRTVSSPSFRAHAGRRSKKSVLRQVYRRR